MIPTVTTVPRRVAHTSATSARRRHAAGATTSACPPMVIQSYTIGGIRSSDTAVLSHSVYSAMATPVASA